MPAESTLFTASGVYVDEPCTYRGFTARETSGSAAAVLRIFDGADNTGRLLETVRLAQSESTSDWNDDGLIVATSLYVEVVSGTVEGAVRWA